MNCAIAGRGQGIANNKPRICFVALNSFNLVVNKGDVGHIGGAEVQQFLAATWLRDKGFPVSFITIDRGQPDSLQQNGFTIYKAYNNQNGLPGLRFIWPRWFKLCSALRRASCDIYYQRGAGLETGQVALWCRLHRKKFIHAVAHEPDCTPELPMLTKFRERFLYRYGLRSADAVIAQTEAQQYLLNNYFGKKSYLVRNCAQALPSWDEDITPKSKLARRTVLWVGRLTPVKRFEWLLELATKMPDVEFVVIGGANKSSEYDRNLQKIAENLSNVKLVGEVQYTHMRDYYLTATALCCTSHKEGFPNVFLEAWREGLPVVSTVDPDNVIVTNDLGCIANTADDLKDHLSKLLTDEQKYTELSNNCRSYFCNNHIQEKTLPVLEQLLITLSANNLH